ncbi:YbjN domain-containing protein [Streptomyces sp. Z26]|uniref:YbjN domain-containing protein n=1 Tax=Streptomyces sp. Z26 TaxID=2500177 RepID=UPI00140489A7|nr:YbjN domain-containing protein [Streptomyces sp. Z26]
MSIDPSSIPNFGGQQPDPQQASGPAGPVIPDQDLVKQLLDQMELKYVVDDEGDLAAPWEEFRTYFMFRGEGDQRVFSVRTFYDRPHSIDEKLPLLESIDDWNRRTLWPKVYTHTHDDGTVRLIGEAQMMIGTGVSLEHFVSSTVSWVRASIEFDKWLVEQLGLEKDAGSGSDADAGAEADAADAAAESGTEADASGKDADDQPGEDTGKS